MTEETPGSELADPNEGGAGLNEGETSGDEQRGGRAVDEPRPQAGGAEGGRADPIAGDVSETAGTGPDEGITGPQ